MPEVQKDVRNQDDIGQQGYAKFVEERIKQMRSASGRE